MRSWTHDRTGWDRVGDHETGWGTPGPWHDEPDKVQWIDTATGYPALAVRNRAGAWCGYVGLPPGHPLYGADYDDERADIDVHGGLTFAGSCDESVEEGHGICHIPEPGQPANVWWLGFDCNHAFDLGPKMTVLPGIGMRDYNVYRTLGYVQAECQRLAAQMAALGP